MRPLRIAAAPILLLLLVGSTLRGDPGERPPLDTPVRFSPVLRGGHILVEKAARRLIFFRGGVEVQRFRVGLGFAPVGPKLREGDGRTPEGEYRVCMKNPESAFHLSLGITYPNAEDARKAHLDKRISRAQRDAILTAARGRGCPPWHTPLGGVIFIHGSGSSSDWTFGCVALDNPDIEFLYRETPVGTPVTIRP